MTDLVDMAQRQEELRRDLALLKQTHRALPTAQYDPDGFRVCLECAVRISTKRVESVNAVRCVECQHLFERQLHKKGARL